MLVLIVSLLVASAIGALSCLIIPVVIGVAVGAICAITAAVLLVVFYRRETFDTDRLDGVTLDLDRPRQPERIEEDSTAEIDALVERIESLGNQVSETAGQKEKALHRLQEIYELFDEIESSDAIGGDSHPPSNKAKELRGALQNAAAQRRESINRVKHDIDDLYSTMEHSSRTQIISSEKKIATSMPNVGIDKKELRTLVAALGELADQSNILAINAAIEAARIGEKGKGFSVIAGEMQNLSKRSETFARELAGYGEAVRAKAYEGNISETGDKPRYPTAVFEALKQASGSLSDLINDYEENYVDLFRAVIAEESAHLRRIEYIQKIRMGIEKSKLID